jgi:GNAT superfamily N-acetyltransferase
MTADYEAAVRNHEIDMLYLGDALVGLVEMAARDHLLIVNVAVAPERQGKGVGPRLMAHARSGGACARA